MIRHHLDTPRPIGPAWHYLADEQALDEIVRAGGLAADPGCGITWLSTSPFGAGAVRLALPGDQVRVGADLYRRAQLAPVQCMHARQTAAERQGVAEESLGGVVGDVLLVRLRIERRQPGAKGWQ